jgi:hypothetical protein
VKGVDTDVCEFGLGVFVLGLCMHPGRGAYRHTQVCSFGFVTVIIVCIITRFIITWIQNHSQMAFCANHFSSQLHGWERRPVASDRCNRNTVKSLAPT